jgi:molybdate transport system ATP-binding protein
MSGSLQVSLSQSGPIPLAAAFDCAPGEMLALVGPSGSGKSTILRSIAGLYAPAAGRIAVGEALWYDTEAGANVAPHRRRAGLVFQNYALFPHMTAAENVAAALTHMRRPERRERAGELLAAVHLAGLEERRPAELSGGQQQRVAVARALARDPQVLLLDEPFSAVDRATRQRLYRELAAMRQNLRMPVVLVTHDLEEAAMLADRMCVLSRGRTLQTGAPEEITAHPRSADVARLLGLRNLFTATVLRHEEGKRTLLDWNGIIVEMPHAPKFSPGMPVEWLIPEGFVVMHRRDRPSRGERENRVEGRVASIIATGPMAQVVMSTASAPETPVFFSVPAHVARRNGLARDASIAVSLLSEGIHILPS